MNNSTNHPRPASLCVGGSDHDTAQGLVRPIQTSTAYPYIDEGPQPYPRYFNLPNQDAVASRIAALEHAEKGLVFSSGMAAISTTMMSLVSAGDHVLLQRGLYGGSHSFFVNELSRWGVEYDFVAPDIAEFEAKRKENTVLAYVETPTNPCLDILDLQALGTFARDAKLTTIIDNTFASPINQNPADFGIDLVLHSGTKYLGGHSDLCCGVVVGRSNLIGKVLKMAKHYGGSLNPMGCHLLERSIMTLDVRVQRQNSNALAIARFLDSQDSVSRVLYPGLESHPGHSLAAKQMSGFGGMMSFELSEGLPVREFLTSLKHIAPAMSLGGVESTVTVPVFTSHAEMTEEARLESGVTPNLLRFSTGIEDERDLIADLTQALSHAGATA